jgi:hypothetical protein
LGVNDTAVLLEAAMIVAQARSGLPLITGDEKIQQSGLVRTLWDYESVWQLLPLYL